MKFDEALKAMRDEDLIVMRAAWGGQRFLSVKDGELRAHEPRNPILDRREMEYRVDWELRNYRVTCDDIMAEDWTFCAKK